MKNYYSILNLSPASSQAEIKAAYRQLALEHHPDKNNGDTSSEERFKEIAEAYIILGDVAKRNAYDYANGYRDTYRSRSTAQGMQTPATFLMLFKKIKNRVLNAGGRVNQEALFKVIDDLLSNTNIEFLVSCGDAYTNSLIIDDILTSCIFLDNTQRAAIYLKLFKLANGNSWLIDKIATLKEASLVTNRKDDKGIAEKPALISILIFILVILFILGLVIISNFT